MTFMKLHLCVADLNLGTLNITSNTKTAINTVGGRASFKERPRIEVTRASTRGMCQMCVFVWLTVALFSLVETETTRETPNFRHRMVQVWRQGSFSLGLASSLAELPKLIVSCVFHLARATWQVRSLVFWSGGRNEKRAGFGFRFCKPQPLFA